jgi:hypothetical protein
MRQFQKLFGDSIKLTWCPSTLDLEKYGKMKEILRADKLKAMTIFLAVLAEVSKNKSIE